MPKELAMLLPGDHPWGLFLDVDGTLLELAARPQDVVVPPDLNLLLDRLHAKFEGAFALVSGRNLAFLDSVLNWKGRDAAGCHGAEFRITGEAKSAINDTEVLAHAAERLIAHAGPIHGALLEIKGQSIAFHYGATAFTELQSKALIEDAVAPVSHAFRILSLRNAIEIVPKGCGKGLAIAEFLQHETYRDRIPVFAGDDLSDEEGFREVNERGGISIYVGDRITTSAQFRARTVTHFHHWLAELLQERVVVLPPHKEARR